MNASEQEDLAGRLLLALAREGLEIVRPQLQGGNVQGWVLAEPTAIVGVLAARQLVLRERVVDSIERIGSEIRATLLTERRGGLRLVTNDRPEAEVPAIHSHGTDTNDEDHLDVTGPSPA